MKRRYCIYFLVVLSVYFWSCNKENAPDWIKSTGEKITVTKFISAYDTIRIFDHIDIELKHSNEYKAEITAGKNLIPKIILDVKDSLLTIKNTNTFNWVRSYKKDDIKIVLYLPILDKLKIEQFGSGKVYSIDTLKCSWVDIDMQSSGDFDLVIDCERFVCSQYRRNYGNMEVRGRCTQLINVNDGIGEFNSLELHCQYARVETVNKGNSYAHVPGPLKVSIVDDGNIYVSGNPSPIEWLQSKTGKGDLILF